MRMKRFLTAVAVVMAILTVGSSAWAFSYTDHVSVAANNQGDLLIYPLYVAAQGWDNRISIINTSNVSVVAKLIVRSWVFSEEVLDFLIYLSPYDMWIGHIRYGATGPEMYSTDSSALYTDIQSSSAPFATETTPLLKAFAPTACSNDSNSIGYVEVIEAWSGVVVLDADKQKRGKAIAAAYAAAPFPNITTVNALAGSFDIDVPSLGWTGSEQAVTLKNYDNEALLATTAQTFIGSQARNNTREVEAALSKNLIAMPFLNSTEGTTIDILTFPTKLSLTDGKTPCGYTGSRDSLYFALAQKQIYAIRAFDNEEQTTGSPFSPARNLTLPNEVNIVGVSDLVFKQGWLEVTLANPRASATNVSGQVLNYTGAPVIPMVVDVKDGLSMRYVSFQDGIVSDSTGTTLPGYQTTAAFVNTAAQ